MSNPRYPEEFKIDTDKQVSERNLPMTVQKSSQSNGGS